MSKFEVGSFWRCRDGKKAEIVANDVGGENILIRREGEVSRMMHPNGTFYVYGEHSWDLVSEWRDPIDTEMYIYEDSILGVLEGNYTWGFYYLDKAKMNGDAKKLKVRIMEVVE